MPKGKARYPAFQMHRKHITALSPTQTYTPKRASTPLIHIRCILTRFPSWLRYQQRLLGGRPFLQKHLTNTLGLNYPKVNQSVVYLLRILFCYNYNIYQISSPCSPPHAAISTIAQNNSNIGSTIDKVTITLLSFETRRASFGI